MYLYTLNRCTEWPDSYLVETFPTAAEIPPTTCKLGVPIAVPRDAFVANVNVLRHRKGMVRGSLMSISRSPHFQSGFQRAMLAEDVPVCANGLRDVPLERRLGYVRRQRCVAGRILDN
jgi:hypothetical protein